ncbi:MAG: hypothetical protein QM756_42135 [Polyangiaceae bacterium]
MNHAKYLASQAEHRSPTRLVEGNLAAVDLCECGMLHLHIGALTLRLDSDAVQDLLNTLGQAVAEQAALKHRAALTQLSVRRDKRGEA